MWNIIRADMFRIVRGKGLYISIGVIIVLLSVSIYLRSPGHMGFNGGSYTSETVQMNQNASMEELRELSANNEEALDIKIASTGGNLYYLFLPVIFMVLCSDLSSHTTKNVIATEVKRSTYYIAKLILSLVISFSFILLYNYGGYFGSLLFNGSSSVSSLLDITIVTLRQLPMYCGIISVLVMIACVSQKATIFNGVSIALIMGIQLIVAITSSIFTFDPNLLLQFEFEGVLRSVSVVGTLPTDTLCIAIVEGIVLFVVALGVGWRYFKHCTIR